MLFNRSIAENISYGDMGRNTSMDQVHDTYIDTVESDILSPHPLLFSNNLRKGEDALKGNFLFGQFFIDVEIAVSGLSG